MTTDTLYDEESWDEMGDSELVWDGSDNRVCVGSVLEKGTGGSSLRSEIRGSCHCKGVEFKVEVVSTSITVLDCNCSVCAKKGYLHWTVPQERVTLSTGSAERMTTYRFGTDVAQHTFCSTCGVQAIYTPKSNPECYSVNVRCLELEGEKVRIEKLDGKTFSGTLHVE